MKINIRIATNWNDLTRKQLEEIVLVLEWYRRKLPNTPVGEQMMLYSKLYLHLVKNLLRSNYFWKVWIAIRQIPPEEYKEHVKYLLSGINRTKFLDGFKIRGKKYYPPLSRLQNISIKEFSFVDSLYFAWYRTKDGRYLDLLCATLYRQKGKEGNELDVRKPYNKILVEQEVKNFRSLPYKKKLAIAYTYEGCRNYIVQLYPNIFPTSKEDSKKSTPKYTPFGQLLQHKIKHDPSKLESTQNLNVHEFLSTYENELIELKNRPNGPNA